MLKGLSRKKIKKTCVSFRCLKECCILQIYIVTQVCPELTPASQFPSDNYTTYENYYNQKYKLNIIDKHQPLLEVKAVSNKINCLRPRYLQYLVTSSVK